MGPLKKIINNCKQATFLIEKKLIGRLTLREKIELGIHLIGCSWCRLYDIQSRKIGEMVRQLFQSSGNADIMLDENFKKELQERIEEELNKN
jgi:hypothetical protein